MASDFLNHLKNKPYEYYVHEVAMARLGPVARKSYLEDFFLYRMVPDFEMDSDYLHEPLANSTHVRLFRLHAGTFDLPLQCTLWEVTDDLSQVSYRCLSYTWNDQVPTRTIGVNGRRYLITESLHSALSRLRHETTETILWTDAICITQSQDDSSLQERSRQVQGMSRTFANAESVIADLGLATISSLEVLHDAQMYIAIPNEAWLSMRVDPFQNDSSTTRPIVQDLQVSKEYALPQLDSAFWQQLDEFLERPWFHRVWVVQEFCLAKRVDFLIGTRAVPASGLCEALRRACDHHSRQWLLAVRDAIAQGRGKSKFMEENPVPNTEFIRQVTDITRFLSCGTPLKLAYLLNKTEKLRATDPRDRVFSLLGLCDIQKDDPLLPDYTDDVWSLSRKVTRQLIREDRGVFALYRINNIKSSRTSWGYNLVDQPRITPWAQRLTPESGTCEAYNACGTTKFSVRPESLDTDLIVRGIILSPLQKLGPAVTDMESFCHNTEWVTKVAGKQKKALWRCIVCNSTFTTSFNLTQTLPIPSISSQVEVFNRGVKNGAWSAENLRARRSNTARTSNRNGISILQSAPTFLQNAIFDEGFCLAIASDDTPCRVPVDAQVGDQLAVFFGCPIPFLLRPNNQQYRIVGPCYVHGMMNGEALSWGKYSSRDMVLI